MTVQLMNKEFKIEPEKVSLIVCVNSFRKKESVQKKQEIKLDYKKKHEKKQTK